jgi:hypothetical protein
VIYYRRSAWPEVGCIDACFDSSGSCREKPLWCAEATLSFSPARRFHLVFPVLCTHTSEAAGISKRELQVRSLSVCGTLIGRFSRRTRIIFCRGVWLTQVRGRLIRFSLNWTAPCPFLSDERRSLNNSFARLGQRLGKITSCQDDVFGLATSGGRGRVSGCCPQCYLHHMPVHSRSRCNSD